MYTQNVLIGSNIKGAVCASNLHTAVYAAYRNYKPIVANTNLIFTSRQPTSNFLVHGIPPHLSCLVAILSSKYTLFLVGIPVDYQ